MLYMTKMKYGIVEAVTTIPLFLAYEGELGGMQYWSENHQVFKNNSIEKYKMTWQNNNIQFYLLGQI